WDRRRCHRGKRLCPWSGPPLSGPALAIARDPRQDFREATPRRLFPLEFDGEFAIAGDQGAGAADHERDFIIDVMFVDKDCYTCKCRDIVLNGAESVIESTGDFVGLMALKVEADGEHAVSLAGADVPLLAAAGNFDLTAPQGLNIADDGAHAAIE